MLQIETIPLVASIVLPPPTGCVSLGHDPRAKQAMSRFNTCAASRKTALIAWRQSFRAGPAVNDACRLFHSRHAPPSAVEIIDSRSSSEEGSRQAIKAVSKAVHLYLSPHRDRQPSLTRYSMFWAPRIGCILGGANRSIAGRQAK